MASSKQVLLLAGAAAVACLASLASATMWMVGDDLGWRPQFNQTGWGDGMTFVVGDSLIFMYDKGNHTVAQVGKDDFAACNTQGARLIWNLGGDVVTLDKPGKAWFICTKANHCANGMKLVIDVVDGSATTPAPAPLPFPFPWPFPIPGVPAAPAPTPFFRSPFPWPFPGAPAVEAPAPSFRGPFPWPFPGVPAAAPSLSSRKPWWGSAKAPSAPSSRLPYNWWGAPAPAPVLPVAAPPSAAVRNPVGGAVAAAVAAVVAALLAC